MKTIVALVGLLAVLAALPAVTRAVDKRPAATGKANASMIREIQYDEKTQTLTVVMAKDGVAYEYYRVPASVYREFVKSRAKGTFYLLRIKGQYEFKKKDK